MTREEQVFFCKQCENRKASAQGLICSLTGEKATFENECPDFKKDETVTPTGKAPATAKKAGNAFFTIAKIFGVIAVGSFIYGILSSTSKHSNAGGVYYEQHSIDTPINLMLISIGVGIVSFVIGIIVNLTNSKK